MEISDPNCKKRRKESETFFAISSYREKILDTISSEKVTLITGPTGCGKTTQVPQYLFDWCASKSLNCNVIIIQPRKMSVLSVCERVCQERGWPVGSVCGYKVGLTCSFSDDTKLWYVTTGVFLQILLSKKDLSEYTHIIFDEIHEREQTMDFALMVVKKYLASNSLSTKIILMSATVEINRFAKYFSRKSRRRHVPAPIINIQPIPVFHVEVLYLDDLEYFGRFSIDRESPEVRPELMSLCIKVLEQLDVLDYRSRKKEAVLVFLPGVVSIEELYCMIGEHETSACAGNVCKWYPIPINGSIGEHELARAFAPAPEGYRKIVIATNVAESSITIPDVSVVIDFCLTKIMVSNSETNLARLQMVWASKANLTQRAGRVGRVADGTVFRLIPRRFMKKTILEYNAPDMTRCLVEKTILHTIMLDMGDPHKFLAGALDPPSKAAIKRAMLLLKELGALPLHDPRNYTPDCVTLLGRLMAVMPIEVRYTRMIILGYIFSVFKESIIIAASMSIRCVFVCSFNQRLKYYHERLRWANGSCSDCFCFLNLYKTWRRHLASGYFERTPGANEEEWATSHCVQLSSLQDVEKLISEVIQRLKAYGIEEREEDNQVVWTDTEKEFVLMIVLAGTFYPNYFSQSGSADIHLEYDAVETLAGRDPFRTALFTHFPRGEALELYKDDIRKYLVDCEDDFEITTNYDRKVFIEFQRETESIMPEDPDVPLDPKIGGGISMSVYNAIKVRGTRRGLHFTTLTSDDIQKKKQEIKDRERQEEEEEERMRQEEDCIPKSVSFQCDLPPEDTMNFRVKVTHVIHPNRFWSIAADQRGLHLLDDLNGSLDAFKENLGVFRTRPKIGQMCVVKCEDALYRGKVILIPVDPKTGRRVDKRKLSEHMLEWETTCQEDEVDEMSWHAKVFLIDTGKTMIVENGNIMKYSRSLYAATEHIPALAFECTLAKVRPSPFKCLRGEWVREAVDFFRNLVNEPVLALNTYSIVNEVVSGFFSILANRSDATPSSCINHRLIKLGYGIRCPERWMSERNHRIRKGEKWLDNTEEYEQERYNYGDFDIDLVTTERLVKLNGPTSPLQMTLSGHTQERIGFGVIINGGSVNSVLLNSYPRDAFSQLLVCGSVSSTIQGTALILCDTTLMPHIAGWAEIIPLMFAPTAEIRMDDERTRYTGALCGLGLDKEGKPRFPQRDFELIFDTEVTKDDLVNINRFRFSASAMLVSQFYDDNMCSRADRIQFKGTVQESVRSLLFTDRKLARRKGAPSPFEWTADYDSSHTKEPLLGKFNDLFMLPPHRPGELNLPADDPKKKELVVNRLEYLRKLVDERREKLNTLDCGICEVACNTVEELGVHLSKEDHRSKVAEFLNKSEPGGNNDKTKGIEAEFSKQLKLDSGNTSSEDEDDEVELSKQLKLGGDKSDEYEDELTD